MGRITNFEQMEIYVDGKVQALQSNINKNKGEVSKLKTDLEQAFREILEAKSKARQANALVQGALANLPEALVQKVLGDKATIEKIAKKVSAKIMGTIDQKFQSRDKKIKALEKELADAKGEIADLKKVSETLQTQVKALMEKK